MTIFLLNQEPTKSINNMPPYEVWHGHKPTIHFLCTFGCVVHVKNVRAHVNKFEEHSKPMVFIEYKPRAKAYSVFASSFGRVHVSCNIIFDENTAWDWEKKAGSSKNGPIRSCL